jgi:hypothetical protein
MPGSARVVAGGERESRENALTSEDARPPLSSPCWEGKRAGEGQSVRAAGWQEGAQAAAGAKSTQLVIQILPRHPSSHATAHWHDLTHRHHGVLTTIQDMQRWIELVGNPNYHHRIIERTEVVVASTRRSSDPAAGVRLIAVRQNA